MSGKSRRGKGKYSFQSKRKKGKHYPSVAPAPPPAVAEASKPITSPKPAVPAASAPPSRVTSVKYPYIVAELRRIGILAGIILAILVVLALVLS